MAGYTLLWAIIEEIAFAAAVPVEQLVWTRYGTHLLVMALVFGPVHGTALARTSHPGTHITRSLMMLVMPLSYLTASAYMSPRNILSVFWLSPLMLLALAGRHQPWWRWACGGAAFAGTMLVLRPGTEAASPYGLLAIAMAASFALYIRLTEDLSTEAPSTNLFHSALWVFLALTPRMPFVWQWPGSAGWLAIVAVSVLGLLSLYLIDLAVRLGGSAIFVPVLYLQPACALLLATGDLDFGRRAAAGVAVVVCAVTAAAIWEARSPSGPSNGVGRPGCIGVPPLR